MARANRVREDGRVGGISHLAHRCHNREFLRQRYRLIDPERLCWRLGTNDLEEVRRNLDTSLSERIARDQMKREPWWTESLAVGSAEFVERTKPLILSRRETEIAESGEGRWVLQEPATPYRQETGSKNAANLHFSQERRPVAGFGWASYHSRSLAHFIWNPRIIGRAKPTICRRSCAWNGTRTGGWKSLLGGASRQWLKVTASWRHEVESNWKRTDSP